MKYAWIEEHRDQFPVTRMCRQLGVSRTGYCQWRTRAPSDRSMANATLDAQVAAMHASSKCSYGRPRIVRGLREQGVAVSHERVRNSLKRQHLRPVYKRPYRVTTDSAHRKPIAPNVLDRRFDGWRVNQAWVADITYIATGEGWLYLAVIMDLASRRIVGWSMSERIKADLVCQALKSAYWRRKPAAGLIMHSDRGSQYASDTHSWGGLPLVTFLGRARKVTSRRAAPGLLGLIQSRRNLPYLLRAAFPCKLRSRHQVLPFLQPADQYGFIADIPYQA